MSRGTDFNQEEYEFANEEEFDYEDEDEIKIVSDVARDDRYTTLVGILKPAEIDYTENKQEFLTKILEVVETNFINFLKASDDLFSEENLRSAEQQTLDHYRKLIEKADGDTSVIKTLVIAPLTSEGINLLHISTALGLKDLTEFLTPYFPASSLKLKGGHGVSDFKDMLDRTIAAEELTDVTARLEQTKEIFKTTTEQRNIQYEKVKKIDSSEIELEAKERAKYNFLNAKSTYEWRLSEYLEKKKAEIEARLDYLFKSGEARAISEQKHKIVEAAMKGAETQVQREATSLEEKESNARALGVFEDEAVAAAPAPVETATAVEAPALEAEAEAVTPVVEAVTPVVEAEAAAEEVAEPINPYEQAEIAANAKDLEGATRAEFIAEFARLLESRVVPAQEAEPAHAASSSSSSSSSSDIPDNIFIGVGDEAILDFLTEAEVTELGGVGGVDSFAEDSGR